MSVPIDKNIPLPPSKRAKSAYPWAEMEVGDSFATALAPSSASASASQAGKRLGKRFIARAEASGSRIWRIA